LVNAKRYDLIAELIELLMHDETGRQQVIAGQRRRLDELAPGRVTETLRACIEPLVRSG
jgi:hypothetical protein